jgi:hypothetical protein
VARDISGIIFENPRVFLTIHGPQLDFTERQVVIYKYSGDFSGVELFFNKKFGGFGPPSVDREARLGSVVDRGSEDKRVRWHLSGTRRAGARARRCSSVAVEGGEPDKAMPEGFSLEHEQRWRGCATTRKTDGGLSSL